MDKGIMDEGVIFCMNFVKRNIILLLDDFLLLMLQKSCVHQLRLVVLSRMIYRVWDASQVVRAIQ